MTNDGIASGFAFGYDPTGRSIVLNRQNTLFDVRCWAFDVRRWMFISFFSLIRLAVAWPEAALLWNYAYINPRTGVFKSCSCSSSGLNAAQKLRGRARARGRGRNQGCAHKKRGLAQFLSRSGWTLAALSVARVRDHFW